MNMRRKIDKPAKKRKGVGKVTPTGIIEREDVESTIKPHTRKKVQKAKHYYTEHKKHSAEVYSDEATKFEKLLIQECRKDGMSDSEIQEWMQEI